MSTHAFDLDLTRPSLSGVYFVAAADLGRLARAAARDELGVGRIDLDGCQGKDELLRRVASSLHLPASFGHNWDALADCLRDPGWMPAWGHVLLFEHVDGLRQAAEGEFNILLGILDDAATFACDHDKPWFAFLALPESPLDDSHVPT